MNPSILPIIAAVVTSPALADAPSIVRLNDSCQMVRALETEATKAKAFRFNHCKAWVVDTDDGVNAYIRIQRRLSGEALNSLKNGTYTFTYEDTEVPCVVMDYGRRLYSNDYVSKVRVNKRTATINASLTCLNLQEDED